MQVAAAEPVAVDIPAVVVAAAVDIPAVVAVAAVADIGNR
jgi:hypothetical protein